MSKPQSFDSWREEAEAHLMSQYCINLNDAGLDDDRLRQEFAESRDPADVIYDFARKFDLTSLNEVKVCHGYP
ncbi:MAG: hypothetical protein JJU26_09175 [Oceanicaulis sp.]|uniref:hypothetical protein n=1 Tax=Glycocaulis sp. TaxID=1969725 RepID=UPI0025C39B7E|nr:hypothetical protein [Glycocaulis sp.]MCC5981874.1 hypothetical protein [Oceanicaulis sp.]MCH8522004.1 hypothetical protein [Glycocaulis sp.]